MCIRVSQLKCKRLKIIEDKLKFKKFYNYIHFDTFKLIYIINYYSFQQLFIYVYILWLIKVD